MFYKRKKVVHLNFKNAKAANASKAVKETKEPTALAALAEHIFRLKFEKNMRKLFGVNKKT
jgi:hypothetical protein